MSYRNYFGTEYERTKAKGAYVIMAEHKFNRSYDDETMMHFREEWGNEFDEMFPIDETNADRYVADLS